MTLPECVALLTPLALAMRVEFDQPTFRAYHRLLEKVPVRLAELALEQMVREGMRFMPRAPEIANGAEKVRRQQLALHPHEECAECEGQKGWRTVLVAGVSKLEKCPCKARHQEKLAGLGLLEPIAYLPGEAPAEGDPVYPTLEQLPAGVRQQLESVAKRKAIA